RGSLDFLIIPLSKNKGAEFLYLDVVISWGQECVCKVHPFGLITIAPLSLMRIIT
ncbi:Late transcription factor 1, partial [Dissostichus eleginoides]